MAKEIGKEELRFLANVIIRIYLFSLIPTPEIDKIVNKFKWKSFSKGDKIIKQGQNGIALYIIKHGKCSVYKKKGIFAKEDIAELKDGDFFGEMSLVFDRPTVATVEAVEDSDIYEILREDFLNIMQENPDALNKIKQLAESRLNSVTI